MNEPKPDEQYSDEETDRRAQDAIRRSFQTPYKPQKEMIGKVGRLAPRKRATSKAPKKAE